MSSPQPSSSAWLCPRARRLAPGPFPWSRRRGPIVLSPVGSLVLRGRQHSWLTASRDLIVPGHSAPGFAFSRARSAKLTAIAASVSAMMIAIAMMNASNQSCPPSVREKMMPGIIAVPMAAPMR